MVVLELLIAFANAGFWIVEELSVDVAVVLNFELAFLTVEKREIGVRAGCEAFDTPFAVFVDLLVLGVVAEHSYSCHRANRPK